MQVRWMAVLSVGGLLLIGPAGDLAWAQASPPLDYFSVSPCRLLDTRVPAQGPALASGASRLVTVTGGPCAIPPTARAIAANITSVASTGVGNLRLYPGDGTVPPTSALNFGAGQTRANNGVFPLAGNGNGTLAILATVGGSGTVHVVLDVTGFFVAGEFRVVAAHAPSSTSVVVTLDRPVDPASVLPNGSQFTFDGGLTATSALVTNDEITVTTTTQTPNVVYTVTVASTVQDTYGTDVGANNTASFIAFTPAAVVRINEINATGISATGTTIQRLDDTDDNDKNDWNTGGVTTQTQTWGLLNAGQTAF